MGKSCGPGGKGVGSIVLGNGDKLPEYRSTGEKLTVWVEKEPGG